MDAVGGREMLGLNRTQGIQILKAGSARVNWAAVFPEICKWAKYQLNAYPTFQRSKISP
jgi:hypothetical protein